MGEDPDVIRKDIEQTRERMGDTVDALGYKTDVKSRAKESVTGKVEGVKEKLVGAKDSAMDATPSTGDVQQSAKKAVGVAQSNPLGLAVGAVAVGFLAGMLIPSTQVENEKIGPMADQVKDQISSTAQEAMEHGKAVVVGDRLQRRRRRQADGAGAGQGARLPAPGLRAGLGPAGARERTHELDGRTLASRTARLALRARVGTGGRRWACDDGGRVPPGLVGLGSSWCLQPAGA